MPTFIFNDIFVEWKTVSHLYIAMPTFTLKNIFCLQSGHTSPQSLSMASTCSDPIGADLLKCLQLNTRAPIQSVYAASTGSDPIGADLFKGGFMAAAITAAITCPLNVASTRILMAGSKSTERTAHAEVRHVMTGYLRLSWVGLLQQPHQDINMPT